MTKIDKALERFYSIPKDFTWDELVKVLESIGYSEIKKGKTGGSRRKFSNSAKHIINLHKPHPENIVKTYALKQVIESLESQSKLSEMPPAIVPDEEIKKNKKTKKTKKR